MKYFLTLLMSLSLNQAYAGGGGDGGWNTYTDLIKVLKAQGLACRELDGQASPVSSTTYYTVCRGSGDKIKIKAVVEYYGSDEHLVDLSASGIGADALATIYTNSGYICDAKFGGLECRKSSYVVILTPRGIQEVQVEQRYQP